MKKSGKKRGRGRNRDRERFRSHESLVQRICHDPAVLGIDCGVILFREKSPSLITPDRETVDIIVLSETERGYEIFVIEVKAGLHYVEKGFIQLGVAKDFFEESWLDWLRRLVPEPKPQSCWLNLLLIWADTAIETRDMIYSHQREKIGQIEKEEKLWSHAV